MPVSFPCPGQFIWGMPSERKPCAQSSQLLVLVVSIRLSDTLPSGAVPSLYRLTVTPGTSGVQLVWMSSGGVVERTRRGVDHLAVDATGFADGVGLLAELDEVVLAGEPCQPSVPNQKGGSIRPVEPPLPPEAPADPGSVQSAVEQ